MVWQKFAERCDSAVGQSYLCVEIAWIDLHHQLAATSAGRQDAVLTNRYDHVDLCLAALDHLGDCGMLRTEADSATYVQTNAGVHATRFGKDRCRHGSGAHIPAAQNNLTEQGKGCVN